MVQDIHSLSVKQAIKKLNTSVNGLSDGQVKKAFSVYGPNELPKEKKPSSFYLLLKQFNNSVVYILVVAALISFFTGHIFDSLFILTVILISSVIGFVQEKKTDNAISKLREMIKYEIEVIRDGRETVILSSNVVVGDLIVLKQGDKIPADARVIESSNLRVSEAVLTGEPVPESKTTEAIESGIPLSERVNMVYAGTVVVRGEARAIVSATGIKTELGKITSLVSSVDKVDSPLQKKIKIFTRNLGVALVFLNFLIFLLGWLMGRDLYQMFLTSVAVIVAAIPEGLLPALVVILAVGMQKILKKDGLVKRMMAAETLGSVSVICTDKTGTLTQGEMRVSKIITEDFVVSTSSKKLKNEINKDSAPNHYLALKIGISCNNVFVEGGEKSSNGIIHGSSTEKALYLAASQAGIVKKELGKSEKRIAEIPFDSEYKFMATFHSVGKSGSSYVSYAKGAPEKIIDFASHIRIKDKEVKFTKKYKDKIIKQYLGLTSEGLRVIAVGYKKVSKTSRLGKMFAKIVSGDDSADIEHDSLKGLVLVGFIALADPLRPDAKESIKECLSAGIRPIIITGDHKLTAKTIAGELGLNVGADNILTGEELDKMSDDELSMGLNNIVVYARVEPRHKLRIVNFWQKRGEVVAMAGDGVNDSPAIKAADIGLALGSGTDIAKETSDLILLNDSFKIIVEAIKRGRIIFYNIKKVILYLLADSFTEMILISGAIFFGWALPILPAQILWIKIIEDTTPAMALSFDEIDEDVMTEKPTRSVSFINKKSIGLIAFYAIVMDFSLLWLFYYYSKAYGDISYARTMTFVGLGITSLFYIYSVRGLKKSVFQINPFSNKMLIASTVLGISMLFVAVYIPFFNKILGTTQLFLADWLILLVYGFMSIVVYEIGKKIFKQT